MCGDFDFHTAICHAGCVKGFLCSAPDVCSPDPNARTTKAPTPQPTTKAPVDSPTTKAKPTKKPTDKPTPKVQTAKPTQAPTNDKTENPNKGGKNKSCEYIDRCVVENNSIFKHHR